ncbi:MAG: hypothetical protein E7654_03350 [Ruminococcaceae bacterium]|nr:hypothetical protein [Oscillospiraceae bacterium]
MHNAAIWARMRAEGIDPAIFSPEELSLVARTAETENFSFPPPAPCPILRQADPSAPAGRIADAAQACLDAVGPCSPIMQDAQQNAAAAAVGNLGRAFPAFRGEIHRLLRQDEEQRDTLLTAVSACRHEERQLICLHTAARISHRSADAAALSLALDKREEKIHELSAALERLETEMEGLSALCDPLIPALLDTAAPLFDPTPEEGFSAADFRAAALALRDACTQLMNDKEEM